MKEPENHNCELPFRKIKKLIWLRLYCIACPLKNVPFNKRITTSNHSVTTAETEKNKTLFADIIFSPLNTVRVSLIKLVAARQQLLER